MQGARSGSAVSSCPPGATCKDNYCYMLCSTRDGQACLICHKKWHMIQRSHFLHVPAELHFPCNLCNFT